VSQQNVKNTAHGVLTGFRKQLLSPNMKQKPKRVTTSVSLSEDVLELLRKEAIRQQRRMVVVLEILVQSEILNISLSK
jgi:uncharacterized protein (DUF4415 family)